MTIRYTEEAHGEIDHPVVRTHVETGRKCLYVNGNFTVRFKDMTEEESAPLLSWLYQHAAIPSNRPPLRMNTLSALRLGVLLGRAMIGVGAAER
jgi:alpha-ketoglutarate-dependent taurine dioxygenase